MCPKLTTKLTIQKHKKKLWNKFKADSKNMRTDFTPFSSISVDVFE